MKKLLIIAALLVLFPLSALAQKAVTLVVSGDGDTKAEATHSALRSAIEQSYGTFISANTTLLDDELVDDEIVSVSSGNINNYKEISSVLSAEGKWFVTLEATVSLSALGRYAKSHGASCELMGATIAENLRLENFYAETEEKAIGNMIVQLRALLPSMFDYELKMEDPIANKDYYVIPYKVIISPNDTYKKFCSILLNTVKGLSMGEENSLSYSNKAAQRAESFKSITGRSYWQFEVPKDVGLMKNTRYYYLRSIHSAELLASFINDELCLRMLSFEIRDNNGKMCELHSEYGFEIAYHPRRLLGEDMLGGPAMHGRSICRIDCFWDLGHYSIDECGIYVPMNEINNISSFTVIRY